MRRHLVIVIAGAVAAAITVVGLGTLVLTRIDARHRNEDELARRVGELSAVVAEVRPGRAPRVAERLAPLLDVDALDVVTLDATTPVLSADDIARLRAGATVSARRGDTAYAAAPLPALGGGPVRRVLLATDATHTELGPAGRWFVVAGAATVLLGAVVALRVARSLAEPLAAAEVATRRIAEGDLAARVPPPGPLDDELARLVGSINTMAASLERSRDAERDFLLSVSHDLRTPLTSISGWAEALTDGTAPDPAAAGATIVAEARRLDRLVRDLLDLARLTTRSFTLAVTPVDLRDVAAGTSEGLRPDLEEAGLTLALDLPPGPVVVAGDADRLAQIAANLIDNAGRHAAREVRVSVAVEAGAGAAAGTAGATAGARAAADAGSAGSDRPGTGPTAVLAVEDDGPGIAAGDRPRVFDRRHARARPGGRTDAGGGLGLGLAIVRELAHAMGGEAVAADAAGGGARLEVRLPLAGAG